MDDNKLDDGADKQRPGTLKQSEQTKPLTHVHAFEPTSQRVMADKKSKHGFMDTLKQFKCECGRIETYDLERKVL